MVGPLCSAGGAGPGQVIYFLSQNVELRCAAAGARANARPPAKYQIGQGVHHFWASWMKNATTMPTQLKKKGRPAWYRATVASDPVWGKCTYAGTPYEGWLYHAY